MMILRCLFLLFTAVCLVSVPLGATFAAETAQETAQSDEGKDVRKEEGAAMEEEASDPVAKAKVEALNQNIVDLARTLDKNQARHFFTMYSNYTLVSTVKAVEKDVRKAVEACAANNKSMEAELNARFSSWQNAVAEPMKEAMAGINNMIVAQDYTTRERIEKIFNMVEDTRQYNSSRFEKIPVSTEEACEYMMSKMGETQGNMVSMLKSTLISYPAILQKTQE